MARKEFTGAAPQTTLSSTMTASTPGAGATFTTASGTGYPTGGTGNFVVKIDAGTASEEKILCSARSSNSFTVATSGRGWDGTTGAAHGGGSTAGTVDHCIDADTMTDLSGHVYDTTRDDHTQYQKKSLVTTAGDIVYATASAVLARLGIGTAYQSLQVNSGATAPTWGASARSTLTATGDLLYASAANTLARLAAGSSGTVLTVSGGLPIWQAPTLTARKTADETITSSTTLQDDDHLLFAVAANEVWTFQLNLSVSCPAGGSDLKLTMVGPTGSTVLWSYAGQLYYNPAGAAAVVRSHTGAATDSHYVDNVANNVGVKGVIVNGSTAGSCKLQWAQNTSSGNGVTVATNSTLTATRTA